MANDNAGNVRVAVTGEFWAGDYGATAPSGTSGDPDSHDPLGYVDENGVTLGLPGEGDVTTIRAWQNGAPVRTLRAAPEDSPTIQLAFLETKIEVVELVLGVSITPGVTDGSFEYKVKAREPRSVVLDVVDGSELIRLYAPRATVTDVDDISLVSTDAIKFGCTLALDLDSEKDYNFKGWLTAFKTPGD